MMKLMFILFVLPAVLVVTGLSASAQTEDTLTEKERQLNEQSFDMVWEIINERHFDTTFGGVDWQAAKEKHRPRLDTCDTQDDARAIMNDLVNELGLSHFGVIPAEVLSSIGPEDNPIDRRGVTGMRVRSVDGNIVVFRVQEDTPAEAAGVKPGWKVLSIDGKSIEEILEPVREEFEDQPRGEFYLMSAAIRRLRGPIDDTTTVAFLDSTDDTVTVDLAFVPRPGKRVALGNLPPMYLSFGEDTLESGIGYFHFNCFFDPMSLIPSFQDFIEHNREAPGIIIDVRGNPGGIVGISAGLPGFLIQEKNRRIGTYFTRDTELKMIVNPRPNSYRGPVAVLIDGLSASAAEFFAGGLKDLERARLFGTRTAGAALPATMEKLPNGDALLYVMANYISAGGEALEGDGVSPHEKVELSREALLDGRDPVIAAAVAWIQSQSE